jgi:hypothetical protein
MADASLRGLRSRGVRAWVHWGAKRRAVPASVLFGPILGSRSRVSEVLNRKRRLGLVMIRLAQGPLDGRSLK